MSSQQEEPFVAKVTIDQKDYHILYELTNDYKLTEFNLRRKYLSTATRYHPDKNQNSEDSPTKKDDAERKFKILGELYAEFKSINEKDQLNGLIKKYQSKYRDRDPNILNILPNNNPQIPSGFGEKNKPIPKKTEDNKPIDPIKPEDKNFFESFKRNYYEKSTAIDYTVKFDKKGLEKCFISFRNREYKRFVKSKNNSSGATEFRHTSIFDKATYENYIFFPDQLNPETLGHDQIILESYKQAVSENKIAKPHDLSHPEKPGQDKAGDEYNFLKFKDDFIRSYTTANQKTGKNTNPNYLTDRLRDRIEIFTGKKTKDDIEPKAPEKLKTIDKEPSEDYQARVRKYNSNLETYKISYAEYQALNSKFDELCKNDNVKKFLDKEKTKYLQEKEAQESKLKEEKEAKERESRERENSIEGRWSRLSQSLLKLQEDASSKIAGVSSEIGSSLGSASSAVHGFSSNFAESAKNGVDSLAITISTSATTTFTQVSSTAMSWLVSIKLPQIKINLPSDKTNAPKNTETSHEPPKEEPATHNEKKRRREDPRQEPEASKRAKEAVEKAKEAVKKARQEIERVAKKDITPPISQPKRPDVAFFGPKAQCHTKNNTERQRVAKTTPSNRTSPRVKKPPTTKPQEGRNH